LQKDHLALFALPALLALGFISSAAIAQQPKYPNYPSETPAQLTPPAAHMDYSIREVMIPMRDGVKLKTFLLIPKGAQHAGILMTRTPYDAHALISNSYSNHLGTSLWGYDNAVEPIVEGGYIRVMQDIRGKYGSEGDYVMNRPLHGPQNPTPVDESTDAWDTIDWLVRNTPESNGKVGVLGISYDGYLSLMPLIHPHPALKVAVPMNPMVDGWRGDDWFHNGAFRQQNLPYIYDQTASRGGEEHWRSSDWDDYDTYMRAGSAGELAKQRGMEQIGFWNKLAAHPAYDAFWSDQAADKILAKEPLAVPTMIVAGLWDQEDIYGPIAVYKAIMAAQPEAAKKNLYLSIGPWYHGQEIEEASNLGAIKWNSDTGLYWRQHVLAPFLGHYLKDPASAMNVTPVTAFETGVNEWEHLPNWPMAADATTQPKPTPLYLEANSKLAFTEPASSAEASDTYISDPAKPVPFRTRPNQPVGYVPPFTWTRWLVDDQREFSGRTDVLTYTTETLTAPVVIAGEPIANLVAATTGTDVDWVVKLIDVYPDEVPGSQEMGGYQLAIAMDILRGRYRESFSDPKPITPNAPLTYRFALPTTNHVFLPGHKVMVQIQSAWFPLYDRNPQTYVPNILFAKPADYQKATETIYHAPGKTSFIELPLISK
jgi:uncharacterized protein